MDTGILKELFVDNLFGTFGEKYGRRFVQLKETDRNAKLKKVDIYDVPAGSMLIKLDKTEPPHSLFKKDKGKCRRCDYVLITEAAGRQFILFIEMKSALNRNRMSDAKKQFLGAECIIDYCSATLKRFHDQNDFFGQYEKRFIVFYKPFVSKRRTRPLKKIFHESPQKNDRPERTLKYPAPVNPSLKNLVT